MINRDFYFIYLYGPETYEFNLSHYVSLASNIIINKPNKVYVYTNDINRLENTSWFVRALIDFFGLIEVHDPKELGLNLSLYKGNHIPYMSHQADILKMELINRFSGIYSDFDSIAVKELPEEYFDSNKSIFCFEEDESGPCGICAGFFIGPKGCPFITANLDRYIDYDANKVKPKTPTWAEFAVTKPYQWYLTHKDVVDVYPARIFEPFYLTYSDVEKLFFTYNPEVYIGSYQVHLWENRNGYILRTFKESAIKSLRNKSTYAELAYKYVEKYL